MMKAKSLVGNSRGLSPFRIVKGTASLFNLSFASYDAVKDEVLMSHLTVEAKSEEGCFYFADDLCVRKPFSPFCMIFSLTFSLLVLIGRE